MAVKAESLRFWCLQGFCQGQWLWLALAHAEGGLPSWGETRLTWCSHELSWRSAGLQLPRS